MSNTLLKMFPACDLSETTIEQACLNLGGVQPHNCVVITSTSNRRHAYRVQAVMGFELRIVPDFLLPSRDTWCVLCNGDAAWSEGAI